LETVLSRLNGSLPGILQNEEKFPSF